jgi:uncharacterized protein (TIGR02001 family)
MKNVLSGAIALTGALLVGAVSADAQSIEMTGNVSIVSDYSYRGISQTQEEPAVQGGIDLSLPSFLYLGIWGSSVNFGEAVDGPDRPSMELDLYGGIAPSFGGFDVDLGAIYYLYPGAATEMGYDFWELYGGLSRGVGPLGLGVSVAYSPDFFGDTGEAVWAGVDASVAVPNTPFTIDGSFGRQTVEDDAVIDYNAWSVGASTELFGTSLGAALTGTDQTAEECDEICDTRVILSIGRSF